MDMAYHLRFLLRNLQEFVWFEVSKNEQSRIANFLNNIDSSLNDTYRPFIRFETLDGYDVTLAVGTIQAMNYLWGFESRDRRDELAHQFWEKAMRPDLQVADEPLTQSGDNFWVLFNGRSQLIEFHTSSAAALQMIASLMDVMPADENSFLPYPDEDDETMALQTKEIAMLIIPQSTLNNPTLVNDDYVDEE